MVKLKNSESFVVDINAPLDGLLGALEFDGATKRSKPNISSGAVVYCRVVEYSRHTGARLSCLNKGFSSKNEMGELKNGMLIRSTREKHKRVEEKLESLGKACKFEIAFGKNGWIWVGCGGGESGMLLYNVLLQLLEGCSEQLFSQMVQMIK